ncbi:6770_t:CDS:2 [Funneliformis geosporum]|nr:6770_t:CDS:2 [Funneliformis geosporum]
MDQNSNLNLGHDFMEIVESSVSPVKSYASHDDMEIVEKHSFSSLARIIEKRYPLDEYYFLQKNSNLLEIF